MEAIGLVVGTCIVYLSYQLAKTTKNKEARMELAKVQGVDIQREVGIVAIVGSQLVSPKLLDITAYLLSHPDYFGKIASIKRVHFTENQPEGLYGGFNVDDGTILINLQRHFDATVKSVKADDDINVKYMSIKGSIWFDVLTTLLHEMFHGVSCDASAELCEQAKTDKDVKKQLEIDCTVNAAEMLIELFRDLDVEPSLMAEEPFFGTRFMKLFIDHIKEGNEEWSIRQGIMHDKSFIFYDDTRDEGMITMRDWVRTIEGGDPDHKDTRWDEDPTPIPSIEKAAVMVADSAPKAAVMVADEAPKVPITPEEIVAAPAIIATEDVPPWDTTALDPGTAAILSVDMEEPDDEEDAGLGGMMAQMVMPGPVAPVAPYAELAADPSLGPPATAPAPAALYVKPACACGAQLVEGNKFCSNCGASLISELPPVVQATPAPPPTAVLPVFANPAAVVQPTVYPQAPASRFTQTLRVGLPNIGMDLATMKGILEEIYRRMHEHCFTKCGFQLCGVPTQNAAGFSPAYAGNVLQPINISDIPGAEQLVIGFDQYNTDTGKINMNVPIVGGMFSGKLTKKDQLPSYAIYINNNGTECKRVFMVQNPFKITPGTTNYSAPAAEAQQGHMISYVWDGADNTGGKSNFLFKTKNGFAEWLV